MAKEMMDNMSTAEDGKTPEMSVNNESSKAPMDKPMDDDSVDAKDIDDALMLLNIMDQETGGKGSIAEIPEDMRNSIKFLVEKLMFVRNLFEDPMFMSLVDDMADQKEDGKTPSMMVAIARNVPMEDIQELADSEEYEGMQGKLTNEMSMMKAKDEEEAAFESSFEESQMAGEAYAKEMGYDEDRKNMLFQKVMDLFTIMGDGKLTRAEFAEVDKMINYDADTSALKDQIGSQAGGSKEVLPDKASIDSVLGSNQMPSKPVTQASGPGMGSMGADAYNSVSTDVTQVGKRKRQMR